LKKRKVVEPQAPEHPWERQPEESDTAWAHFVEYRDAGPAERSLSKLAAKHHKQRQNFARWSAAWDWVARCAAYDSWVDRQAKLVEVEAIKDMRKRHVQMAMSLQGAAALALNKIIAAERATVTNPDGTTSPAPLTLKPSEVKELADLGTKLERLTRGEPTEVEVARLEAVAPPIVHDYSNLSTEELRTLRALIRKARSDA
jgi:hypothetical protein